MVQTTVDNKSSLADRCGVQPLVQPFTLKIMVLQTSKQAWSDEQKLLQAEEVATKQKDGRDVKSHAVYCYS